MECLLPVISESFVFLPVCKRMIKSRMMIQEGPVPQAVPERHIEFWFKNFKEGKFFEALHIDGSILKWILNRVLEYGWIHLAQRWALVNTVMEPVLHEVRNFWNI
jgi:hypothetical protein